MVPDRDRQPPTNTEELIDQSQDLLFHMKAVQLRNAAIVRRSHALVIAALLALQNCPIVIQLLDL